MGEIDPLYQIKVSCGLCENSFQTLRVRPSFKKASKTDTDFCVHYKAENPDYYVVRVCPACGFASTDNFSERMTDAQRKTLKEKVSANWAGRNFGKARSWEDALQTYKLALISAQLKDEKDRIIAGLLQHIAWLYRYKGDVEKENKFLQFALDAYVKVYEKEGGDVNNARLMYLMGEINRRLAKYTEAVQWFGRVINDQTIVDAGMIRACREQWAVVREDMLAAKMEPSEELKQNNS